MVDENKIRDFIHAYKVCALWSSSDESDESGGEPMDKNYDVDDIHPGTIQMMEMDCREFVKENESLLDQVGDYEQHGHDFFLTRNGHGAGFWDRGYGEIGETLTKKSEAKCEFNLFVGDDGKIYGF